MGYNLTRRSVLLVYAVLVIVPMVVVVAGSFKSTEQLFASPFGLPSSLKGDNYRTVLGEGGIGAAFRNSVIVTGLSVPLTLFVASLAAYAVARIPGWRGAVIYGWLFLG